MSAGLLILAAYLLGSVPTGVLLARARGIDIRTAGSGNIGATNVLRTTGKLPALLTLLGDFLKGLLPVLIATRLNAGIIYSGMVGIAAILGHNYPIYLKFRGGKGVATSLGVLSVYSPVSAAATAGLWLATAGVTRYSSLGALVGFGALPVTIMLLDSREKLPAALIMATLLVVRHRDNIRRLLQGKESKIGSKT